MIPASRFNLGSYILTDGIPITIGKQRLNSPIQQITSIKNHGKRQLSQITSSTAQIAVKTVVQYSA